MGNRLKQKWPEWLIASSGVMGLALNYAGLPGWLDEIFLHHPGAWVFLLVLFGGLLGHSAYEKIIEAIANLERRLDALTKRDE